MPKTVSNNIYHSDNCTIYKLYRQGFSNLLWSFFSLKMYFDDGEQVRINILIIH